MFRLFSRHPRLTQKGENEIANVSTRYINYSTMSTFIYLALACLLATVTVAADISSGCMDCICKVEGCESQLGKCRMDVGSLSCGPFQIKEPYWIDCGRLGGDWKTCTTQMACSRACVVNYMKRYGTYCTGGRTPTCQDYARIHNGGPNGCTSQGTVGYWQKVQTC